MAIFNSSRAFLVTAFVAATTAGNGWVQTQDASAVYVPGATSVAVLPVVNVSGEPDPNFKAGQIKAVSDQLRKEFATRGFKVLDDKIITDAVTTSKIDLTDEEQHSRKMVITVGASVKADLAVFVVINKVYTKSNEHFFTSDKEGHAKITIWLVDVKQQKPLLSAKSQESKQGSAEFFANSVKGSEQIFAACSSAVKAALAVPLKPYAVAKEKGSQ